MKREDLARRFRQECKFYPKLRHPNIVRMRKAGVSPDDVAHIVMGYLEGRTLSMLLNKAYRLDFLSAMHVMLQVADAMTFVHSLARRLAQERIKAERQAAFAGVELGEDSAPVKGEAGERPAGEEETELDERVSAGRRTRRHGSGGTSVSVSER